MTPLSTGLKKGVYCAVQSYKFLADREIIMCSKLSAPSVYTLGGAYIDLVLYSGIGRPGEG